MNVPTADLILPLVDDDPVRAAAARAALAYVAEAEPDFLANHSIRSYLFANALGEVQGLEPGRHYDDIVLFLACLLHDIGLTDRATGAQRFEVEGADHAAAFVLEHGLSQAEADLVWDAVALHTSTGIASRKQPEVALAHAGIGLDIFGFGAETLPADVADAVHARYPRLDLEAAMVHAVLSQVSAQPSKATPFSFAGGLVNEKAGREVVPGYATLSAACPWRDYR